MSQSPASSARRWSWIVGAALLLYCVGFVIWWPRVLNVADEAHYVGQAVAFARGHAIVPATDPLTGEKTVQVPLSGYPVGTSLMQAPFVLVGGWRAAPLVSLLSLVLVVALLARWLVRTGRSPLYSLVVLGFVPVLVLGRSGMSDMPSALFTTIGVVLFLSSPPESIRRGVLTGFVAGAAMLVRETNALVFVPLFLGAVVRRERRAFGLAGGGLLGAGLRPLAAYLLFGEARALRSHLAWSLEFFGRNAPLSLFSLLILIPGGLIAVAAYRGARRPELIATLLGFFFFFTSYEYGAFESGGLKRLVLAPRYFIPVLPLFVVAIADVGPRLWQWLARTSRRLRPAATIVVGIWVAAVCVGAFAVHPALGIRERSQLDMIRAIYQNTSPDALVVTNVVGTRKLLAYVYGDRVTLDRDAIRPDDLPRLFAVHRSMQVVLLDRSDSDFFRQNAEANRRFVAELQKRCDVTPVHDQAHSQIERLRVWNAVRCAPSHRD